MIPGQEEPLKKGTATHSHVLAWRIPMERGAWWAAVRGVKRVGHDRVTNTFTWGTEIPHAAQCVQKKIKNVIEFAPLLQTCPLEYI